MKHIIKLKTPFRAMLIVAGSMLISCSSGNKKEADHDHKTKQEGRINEEENHSDHDASGLAESGNKMWLPKGDGIELINNDFHFITGSVENIKPEVIQSNTGESVLKLTPNGTPTAFVFHQTYGNIGMAARVNTTGLSGSLKLVHHAQNDQNYEFVALNGTKMKLGRVVNGVEEIMNEGNITSSDWLNLRVSAAGTHFKGYIDDKTVTHGHGDQMKDGYVGIMISGTGQLLIESIEVVKLENE